jgi:hypothetical protein
VTAVALARSRTGRFRPARMLRLEIRHSPIVWVLPLLAAIFYFNTYRNASGLAPNWASPAAVVTGPMLVYLCLFAAGLAAWVGSREGRRKTGDLLATTARAAWARQATVLGATAFWMVLAFLAETAVVYIVAAGQATWGGPPLLPVAVGVVCTVTACAVGFTAGTLFPGRFTAPIVAVAVFVLEFVGVKAANNVNNSAYIGGGGTSPLLMPDQGLPHLVEAGVFYRVPPDVSLAQLLFMGGLLLVAGGLLGLAPAARVPGVRGLSFSAARRSLAVVAAVAVAGGVAASATAFSLAGTATYNQETGWVIPALHDAASDRPVPYTPVCAGAAFPVCIHPAYAGYLNAMTAALDPAAAEIAGLPGAPVRAELAVGFALPAPAGTTSVYAYSGTGQGVGGAWFGLSAAQAATPDWEHTVQQSFLFWFVSGPAQNASGSADPAQQAIADALLARVGALAPDLGPFTKGGAAPASSGPAGPSSSASAAQIAAAARRFESLPSAARRAWLTTNVAALRSGAVTLAQVP